MPSFTTTLLLNGNNVGIEVPEDVVLSFGVGKRVPVIVTIAGYSYPSTIAVMGGQYLVPMAAEHRKEHVRSVTDAKSEATRLRRIEKVVEALS